MINDIKKIVAEIGSLNSELITEETNFIDDLEFDSMDILELVTTIEKKYNIDIPNTCFFKLTDLSSVQMVIQTLLVSENINE